MQRLQAQACHGTNFQGLTHEADSEKHHERGLNGKHLEEWRLLETKRMEEIMLVILEVNWRGRIGPADREMQGLGSIEHLQCHFPTSSSGGHMSAFVSVRERKDMREGSEK